MFTYFISVCNRSPLFFYFWKKIRTIRFSLQKWILHLSLPKIRTLVQYVSVIAWVFDFQKFITITDVSLQPMNIACAPIVSICSQHGLSHQRYTKYLIPFGCGVLFEHSFSLIHRPFFLLWPTDEKNCAEENSEMSSTGLLSYRYKWYFLCRIWWFDFSILIVILSGSALQDEIKSCTAVLMLSSSPASFSIYGIFIPKVRVPSSSHLKIINIDELCPKVDSPLERTSEGNPRVQDVDQLQNPTKNPFTYLMSTVAFFKPQMIYFVVVFFFFFFF